MESAKEETKKETSELKSDKGDYKIKEKEEKKKKKGKRSLRTVKIKKGNYQYMKIRKLL